ncbi:hypothetical protein TNCV_3632621 [Trichonephila clavipes]|nr:hypothetical protein TNCV_3632621 [Trichonephila clavipes]
MSSFLVLSDGDTRNRWRDGQVCPDVGQGTMAPWARRPGCVLACDVQIGRGRPRVFCDLPIRRDEGRVVNTPLVFKRVLFQERKKNTGEREREREEEKRTERGDGKETGEREERTERRRKKKGKETEKEEKKSRGERERSENGERRRKKGKEEKKSRGERERGARLVWRKGLSPRLEWTGDERRWR